MPPKKSSSILMTYADGLYFPTNSQLPGGGGFCAQLSQPVGDGVGGMGVAVAPPVTVPGAVCVPAVGGCAVDVGSSVGVDAPPSYTPIQRSREGLPT